MAKEPRNRLIRDAQPESELAKLVKRKLGGTEEKPILSSAIEDFPGRTDIPLFSNQFYVSVGPHTTQLTLGEYTFNGQTPNWFSTVVMTTPVAVDLAQKILKLAKDQGIQTDETKEPDVLG